MKSLGFRVLVLFGTLALAAAGCEAPSDGGETDEGMIDEEEVQTSGQAITLTPEPFCQDLVLQQMKLVFCGPQVGPYDTSPVSVQCTRECVTHRHLVFSPSGATCTATSTECDPWYCPPCD